MFGLASQGAGFRVAPVLVAFSLLAFLPLALFESRQLLLHDLQFALVVLAVGQHRGDREGRDTEA